MNAWGITLLWTAVQVSLLSAAGLCVYLVVRRQSSAAAAWALSAVLMGVIGLSALGISPWPRWASIDEVWHRVADRETSSGEATEKTAASQEAVAPIDLQGSAVVSTDTADSDAALAAAWREFAAGFEESKARDEQSRAWRWPAWLALLTLAGICLGFVRLAVAMVAARRYGARATVVEHPQAIALLDETQRDLGCTRRIELRQSEGIGSPCTLGWLRPIIVLPRDWQSWTEDELRSVLAHEVAHIARGDFAAGVLAQLGVALHFYNPLVWWLAGRLRLEQELAADACGVRLAGGRQTYLTTLARMALRQNDLPLAARAFFPARDTLLRRVEMLHQGTMHSERSVSWRGRAIVTLLLVVAGGLLAGLRGPDASTAIAAPPEAAADENTPEDEEIRSIVEASNFKLQVQKLNADLKKLEAYIAAHPDRVTRELQLARLTLQARLREIGNTIARHPELLIEIEREGGKTPGPGSAGSAAESLTIRYVRARINVAKAHLAHLEAVQKRFQEQGKNDPVMEQEIAKASADLRSRELLLSAVIAAERGQDPSDDVDTSSTADSEAQEGNVKPDATKMTASLRQQSMNKLYRIGVAVLVYLDEHGHFPAAVEMGPDGKTPHSWRVAILPYLDSKGRELSERYRLDEPWDSENNLKVMKDGADLFSVPSDEPSDKCGYFALVGPGSVFFPADHSTTIREITDGTSKTIALVEAKRDIPWTKPEDVEFEADKPLPKLGGFFEGGYYTFFCDGHSVFVPANLKDELLRKLITKAGREPWDHADIVKQADKAARVPTAHEEAREVNVNPPSATTKTASLRQQSIKRLKMIGVALHGHHDAQRHFPSAVEMGPDGKTPHSWRVALLPYFGDEEAALYKKYRLDEPWDSDNNKKVIAEGAHLYSVPTDPPSDNCGYFVLTGPGAVFDPDAPASTLLSITDGTSPTMGVVEAMRDVPWTKPEDIPYSPEQPLPQLGGFFEGGFDSVFMDGAAHFIPNDIGDDVLRALISKAGGEPVDVDRQTGRLKLR